MFQSFNCGFFYLFYRLEVLYVNLIFSYLVYTYSLYTYPISPLSVPGTFVHLILTRDEVPHMSYSKTITLLNLNFVYFTVAALYKHILS